MCVTRGEVQSRRQLVVEVTELDGSEGGRWRVTTLQSAHFFDFDAGTVQRFPGAEATPMPEAGPQLLRSLERCRVGETGFWTLLSSDFWVEYLWHRSSTISRIERLDAAATEQEAAL